MGYILSQDEYRRLKTRLTRAENAAQKHGGTYWAKLEREAAYGLAIFDEQGYPDAWSRWTRALDDARYQQRLASNEWGF